MTANHQKSTQAGSVLLPALFRLSLLVTPETFAVRAFSHSVLVCVIVCVAILAVWLSVDVGPFRAESATKVSAEKSQAAGVLAGNWTNVQWWNGLFCRVLLVVAVFHSKLTL